MATNDGSGPNPVDTEVTAAAFLAANLPYFVSKVDPAGGEIQEADLDTNFGQLMANRLEDMILALQSRQLELVFGVGTLLQTTDFVLSSGWGDTAIVQLITSGSTASRGEIQIRAQGTGFAANPTFTLTFPDGALPRQPIGQCQFVGGNGAIAHTLINTLTTTQLVVLYAALPVDLNTYRIAWQLR